jgi:hypothetical protein
MAVWLWTRQRARLTVSDAWRQAEAEQPLQRLQSLGQGHLQAQHLPHECSWAAVPVKIVQAVYMCPSSPYLALTLVMLCWVQPSSLFVE